MYYIQLFCIPGYINIMVMCATFKYCAYLDTYSMVVYAIWYPAYLDI